MIQEIISHCYVAGIRIPINAFSVSGQVSNFCSGYVDCAWSPFLSKLHKGVKITIVKYVSGDDFATLEFDGTIQGIIENKGSDGQNSIQLTFVSDGYIWTLKKKAMFMTEELMNQSMIAKQFEHQVDSQSITINSGVIDPTTMVFQSKLIKGDAAKAAAMFLTCAYDNDGENLGAFTYCMNGITKKSDGTIAADTITKSGGYLWSKWLQLYFGDYQLPYKVGYIAVSEETKAYFVEQKQWDVLKNAAQAWSGTFSYWDMSSHFAKAMQCEILCIPNPTYIQSDNISMVDNSASPTDSPTGLLAEYIVKPVTCFGSVPLCNIIFPDQIKFKTSKVDQWGEITRVFIPIGMLPSNLDPKLHAISALNSEGPKGLTDYFSDYNMRKDPEGKKIGMRSNYEEYFGVNPMEVSVNENIYRYLAANKKLDELNRILNAEFMKFNLTKYQMTVVLTPDVRVVPGMSVLILDRDGDHTIAYCNSFSYTWEASGRVSSSITLIYPHRYSLDTTALSEYSNSLSPDSAESHKLEKMIGSAFLAPGKAPIEEVFKEWRNKYDGNSYLMKKNEVKYTREIATLADFLTFHGMSTYNAYDHALVSEDGAICDKFPLEILAKFDSSRSVGNFAVLKYNFVDPYNESGTPTEAQAIFPEYDDIGKYGPIVPSVYTSGILDCHLKYLKRVANFVNI